MERVLEEAGQSSSKMNSLAGQPLATPTTQGSVGIYGTTEINYLFEWAGLGESRGGVAGLIKYMRAVQV